MRPDQSGQHPTGGEGGCAGLVLRLAWFAGGHLALVVFALLIAQRGRLSIFDAAYWLTIVAILTIRRIDVTRFAGLDRDGHPATLRDWRRHVVLLTLIGGGIWAVIHGAWRWFDQ